MNFYSATHPGMRGRNMLSGLRGGLRQVSGLGQFEAGTSVPNIGTNGVSTTTPGASGGFDWAGIVSGAAKLLTPVVAAVSQYKIVDKTAEVQKAQIAAQAAAGAPVGYTPGAYYPNYSPAYSSIGGGLPSWVYIGAGVGLLGLLAIGFAKR